MALQKVEIGDDTGATMIGHSQVQQARSNFDHRDPFVFTQLFDLRPTGLNASAVLASAISKETITVPKQSITSV